MGLGCGCLGESCADFCELYEGLKPAPPLAWVEIRLGVLAECLAGFAKNAAELVEWYCK
jgi:hypothetical protein